MSRFTTAALAGAVLLLAGATGAQAGCSNGVCTRGTETGDSRLHVVYLTNSLSGATHYNVIAPGQPQFELHIDHFQFDTKPGHDYTYKVQVCKRGGVFSSSTCLKWSTFHYSTPAAG
jgi:hypothetical protein